MKAYKVFEKFSEEGDPIEDLDIGNFFGFTNNLRGIEYNNGVNAFYVKPSFMKRINPNFEMGQKTVHFSEKFPGVYGKKGSQKYKCDVYFRLVSVGDKLLYKAIGSSGSHGFAGGQYTQRETLAKTYVKQILEQLYNHLLTLK
jgi:hypothetical protein